MEDFVTFEIAKKLKEKGFDYPCIGHYVNSQLYVAHYQNAFHSDNDESVDAPTIPQVLKWLREEKEIMVFPAYSTNTSKWYCVVVNADSLEQYNLSLSDSYEQAALAGIKYTLNNLI